MICLCGFLFIPFLSGAVENKNFVYDDHSRRDPFWPLVNSQGVLMHYDGEMSAGDMILEGIMSDENGNNLAVINGSIVGTGAQIGIYTIKAVDQDRVILLKKDEEFVLKLKKEGIP